MKSDLIILASVVIYPGLIVGLVAFLRWRRKSRWPFKPEHKLLRAPGESLRRRISELEEKFFVEFLYGLGGTAAAVVSVCFISLKLQVPVPVFRILLGVAAVSCLAGSLWRVARLWQQRQNLFLGWFGERVVGERLDEVRQQGWRVFHDVPFESDGKKFNIDHVAVGLGGVYLFETKTRRKGHVRGGQKDSEVIFDGTKLTWPWGTDDHGLAQAEVNAQTLSRWIKAESGERVSVTPYLVIPSWFVSLKPGAASRPCRVANEKWLGGILARAEPTLTAKQVELISLRLDIRCRDVED